MSEAQPYDTEVDFGDGTSLLLLQLDGGQIGTVEWDGWVTAYGFDSRGQIDSTKWWYCMIETGYPNCYVPPKWTCPYIAGTYGLIGGAAAVAFAKKPGASIVGGYVGAAVQQYCDSLHAGMTWSKRYRTAATHNSLRFS
jgi:hypothetical protein